MLKRKMGLVAAVLAAAMMFTSCVVAVDNSGSGDDNGGNGGSGSSVDYTNYTKAGDYAIKVRNESSKDVVCFVNKPSTSTLLSGARSGLTTGLKLNKEILGTSQDFVLFVVTEEDYLANKGNLKNLEKTPFAMVYAYYNADSDSNANNCYTISASMGGQYYLLLNNGTDKNVELRQNGLNGESLCFAGANTVQTKVYVADADYYIYPVFRKFQKKTGEIVTCYPKEKGIDKPVYFEFSLSENGDHSQEFLVSEWFDPNCFKDYSTPGSAYITIHNGNTRSGCSLYKGANSEAEVTSTGGKKINAGKDLVFEVPMVSTSKTTFASTAKISGWKVGSSQDRGDVPELTVQAGKMYYLDVGGTSAYDWPMEWRTVDSVIVADDVNFEDD